MEVKAPLAIFPTFYFKDSKLHHEENVEFRGFIFNPDRKKYLYIAKRPIPSVFKNLFIHNVILIAAEK